MKSILLLTIVLGLFTNLSLADEATDSFRNVSAFKCTSVPNGRYWISGDTRTNTLRGSIFSKDFPWTFDNQVLRDNDTPEEDLSVGVMEDFLGSGENIFGGMVASTAEDPFSFGTLFLHITQVLPDGSPVDLTMNLMYVEAMTGRQTFEEVRCTFQRSN